MERKKINPDLEVGDEIVLLSMDDYSPVPPLTRGVVKSITKDPFSDIGYIISVDWDADRSLSLLSELDKWMLASDYDSLTKRKLKESTFDKNKNLIKGSEFAKYYKMAVLIKFLEKLRKSGVTNMFGAAPYLYMGKDRIKHKHFYDQISEDNESYDELLGMADEVQSIMIKGSIKKLEDEGKVPDPSNINSKLNRDSQQILLTWISTLS
jgi:hypothetical protein